MVGIKKMTLNCNNINLTKGKQGDQVKELQTNLKTLGYYTRQVDGDYGTYTDTAVRAFQKKYGLLVDGIVGPVTCQKINNTLNNSRSDSYVRNGVYHSGPHLVGTGCNNMGQCNGYCCAPCSIRQQFAKQGIDNYTQSTIARYAGTTTAGTSHWGIETAIAKIARLEDITIKVEWKNFSDLGSTLAARFKALGEIIAQPDKGVILHTLYQNKYGHYETIQEVKTNNSNTVILNSLGSKCNSPAYCGRKETRTYAYLAQNLKGISQKSVCILTFTK